MKSKILHTVWCSITGEAAGEIWTWSLFKGLKAQQSLCVYKLFAPLKTNKPFFSRLISFWMEFMITITIIIIMITITITTAMTDAPGTGTDGRAATTCCPWTRPCRTQWVRLRKPWMNGRMNEWVSVGGFAKVLISWAERPVAKMSPQLDLL